MSRRGFIKLDRKLLDWRWYHDANTMRVFVHLLLIASIKDYEFEGHKVKRGEVVTSYESLALTLKMTIQNVRTAISHLKLTGEVTSRIYPKYQVISIKNYNSYQAVNRQTNTQLTPNQQAANRQLTTIKEINKNNNKNVKKEDGATSPNSDDWSPPPKGTPEYEAWRNQ